MTNLAWYNLNTMASGQTPTYLLPYPLATDPVDIHGDIFDLAGRLEDVIGGLSSLPAQSGNNGKFLTTNGSAASWAVLPLSGYAPISNPSFTDSMEFYGADYIYLDLYGDFSNTYLSADTTSFEVAVFPDFGSAGANMYLDKDRWYTQTYNAQLYLNDTSGLKITNDSGYSADKIVVQGHYSGDKAFSVNGFKVFAGFPLAEKVYVQNVATPSFVNLEVSSFGAVTYYTSNAISNWTINIKATAGLPFSDLLGVGETSTVVFMNTNGATAYYPTTIQIDGVAQIVRWQGGTAPTSGNPNSIDVYTFAIIKTGVSTYTVLGSQTKFA